MLAHQHNLRGLNHGNSNRWFSKRHDQLMVRYWGLPLALLLPAHQVQALTLQVLPVMGEAHYCDV
jgi:hypothetical protein